MEVLAAMDVPQTCRYIIAPYGPDSIIFRRIIRNLCRELRILVPVEVCTDWIRLQSITGLIRKLFAEVKDRTGLTVILRCRN